MRRLYIPLLLFLLVIVEGVALDLLPVANIDTMIVPHFALMFLVLVTIFYDKKNTYAAVIYSIVFGLLIDIIYTGVLGVYMFSYAIVIYLVHKLESLMHTNISVTVFLGLITLLLTENTLYIIYSVIDLTDMLWLEFLLYRLLPTVLANLIFLIILYPIMGRALAKWFKENTTKNMYL